MHQIRGTLFLGRRSYRPLRQSPPPQCVAADAIGEGVDPAPRVCRLIPGPKSCAALSVVERLAEAEAGRVSECVPAALDVFASGSGSRNGVSEDECETYDCSASGEHFREWFPTWCGIGPRTCDPIPTYSEENIKSQRFASLRASLV